jgi:hypothetical protein
LYIEGLDLTRSPSMSFKVVGNLTKESLKVTNLGQQRPKVNTIFLPSASNIHLSNY